MDYELNRVLVNTIVRKAIHDLKTDPERSVRNLIDMALQFSDDSFQQNLYTVAHNLLDDEKSSYYLLVKDTLAKVNEDTLLTFGMNLGYNGFFEGATMIRKAQNKAGYYIPWSISMDITEGRVFEEHHHVIDQGEQMGIHGWYLFSTNSVIECMLLARNHPKSAFAIFCSSNMEGLNALNCLEDVQNVAILVPFDKEADAVCSKLREAGMLYGLYYSYTDSDIERIENGELLHDMEQLNPSFSVLKPLSLEQKEIRDRVHKWVMSARLCRQFKTIPWELYNDTLQIDEIISEKGIWVGFDRYGQLYTERGADRSFGHNIYINDLHTVLERAFANPKNMS